MKRDLDLVRDMLLKAEQSSERWFDIGEWQWTDHDMRERELRSKLSDAEIFHLDLMSQGGLIRRSVCEHSDIEMWEITWAGYDYLDATRDEDIWEQTKSVVSQTGGSFAIELVKSVAMSIAKAQIKKHMGLEL